MIKQVFVFIGILLAIAAGFALLWAIGSIPWWLDLDTPEPDHPLMRIIFGIMFSLLATLIGFLAYTIFEEIWDYAGNIVGRRR